MSPHSRRRHRLALAWFLVAGTATGVHAQDTSESLAPVQAAPNTVATSEAPPFRVAGVVITPAQRSALLVVLDDARRDVGVIALKEGESFGGYSVAAVEPTRVLLEQRGTVFSVLVGRPYTGPKGAPDGNARAGSGPIFIPGPNKPTPDLEYTSPQGKREQGSATSGGAGGSSPDPEAIQNLLQRLFNTPKVQERIDERRPILRQRLERARQDREVPPDAPSATPTPPQGTTQ